MEIAKIIAIGLATAVAVLLLRQLKPELAVVVGLIGMAMVFLLVVSGLVNIITSLQGIVAKTGVATQLFASILKIVGIGYLCEIAANICQDAGSRSMADMIILGGKVTIMVLAIPIVQALVDVVLGVLQ